MIEVERLCDVAARRLEPDNAKAGRKKTDRQIRPLRWTMIAFNFLFGLIGAISVIVLISSIILIIKGEEKEIENYLLVTMAISLTIAIFSFLSGRVLQKRKFLSFSRPYDIRLPDELDTLMDELKSGQLLTAMRVADGPRDGGTWQAADGQFYDHGISPTTFSNRYAPILLSSNPKHYRAVSMPKAERMGRPIYVYRRPATRQNEEPPCNNHDPRDQWLVGGALRDFEHGREAFIAEKIPPHNAEWFRTVLTIGRREMRKGRQFGAQKQAIAIIQKELGNTSGLRGGESQHLIKQLLQGRYGGTDIKRYFTPPKA